MRDAPSRDLACAGALVSHGLGHDTRCRPNRATCPLLYIIPLHRLLTNLHSFPSSSAIPIPFPHLLPCTPNRPVTYYRPLSLTPSKLLYVCPRVPPKTVPVSIPFFLLFLYSHIISSLGTERSRTSTIIRYRHRNPY